MFEVLDRFLRRGPEWRVAADLYDRIVEAARQPALYRQGRVPDSVDGRFDMIALHAFVLFHRLSGEEGWEPVGDRLARWIMTDMDRSLREMGIGDMSIGKKMKKLASAFYGRLDVYWGALKEPDPQRAMADALARNVYRDGTLDEETRDIAGRTLARYVEGQMAALAEQSTDRLLNGTLRFEEAESLLPGDGGDAASERKAAE